MELDKSTKKEYLIEHFIQLPTQEDFNQSHFALNGSQYTSRILRGLQIQIRDFSGRWIKTVDWWDLQQGSICYKVLFKKWLLLALRISSIKLVGIVECKSVKNTISDRSFPQSWPVKTKYFDIEPAKRRLNWVDFDIKER